MADAAPAFTPPRSMARLLEAASRSGRNYRVQHQADSDGDPFVTVTVRWPGPNGYQPNQVDATWHTRDTGTYRLSRNPAASWARRPHQELSLTRATAFVAGEWVPEEVAALLEATERTDPN